MAVASTATRSTLNPNAQPFVPSYLQRVDDFSPKWWELVMSSSSFRGQWLNQREEEIVEEVEEVDDLVALLPETFEVEEFFGGSSFVEEKIENTKLNYNYHYDQIRQEAMLTERIMSLQTSNGIWSPRSKTAAAK